MLGGKEAFTEWTLRGGMGGIAGDDKHRRCPRTRMEPVGRSGLKHRGGRVSGQGAPSEALRLQPKGKHIMKRILFAAGLIAALHTPAHADGWWVLMTDTTTDPMRYFCQSEAPAEGFASLVRQGFVPRYIDKGTTGDGEAIVEVTGPSPAKRRSTPTITASTPAN
jgi:hypothetical protein